MKSSWTLLILLALALVACGTATPEVTVEPVEAAEPASEIVIFNWSEYLDPDIYTQFEEETGISVVEDTFSSNEEMLARLQGGTTGYALVVPSDYTVAIMIEEGMLAPLNKDNVPNLANLSDNMKNVPYDPGNEYCSPYQWGTTGIGYLSDKLDEPASWSIIFEPDEGADYFGRYTMLDDSREAFAAALIYLGYDINTISEPELEEARDLLIQAKAGVSGYDSDTFEDLVASEENLLAHGWNGDFLFALEDNENIAYTVPQEGGVIWIDNICIPITATPEEKLAAEMFIDYLLDPEIGAQLSEWNYYASPNAAAEEILGEEFTEDPAVYPPAEVMARLHFIEPLGEAESLYQRYWDEVKAAQ